MNSVSAVTGANLSCLQKINQSKWTDIILAICCVAFLIIAILATVGVFNFMGTINAAYLSYTMYAGAVLFALAEVANLAIKYGCSQTRKSDGSLLTRNSPLSDKEIQELKEQAKKFAKNEAIQLRKHSNLPV
jgi:type II secretory pathway pseudopilin PulG